MKRQVKEMLTRVGRWLEERTGLTFALSAATRELSHFAFLRER